jgi:DNA polymerase sigma
VKKIQLEVARKVTGASHSAYFISAFEYLIYLFLTGQRKKSSPENQMKALLNLQGVLAGIRKYGPVRCSGLEANLAGSSVSAMAVEGSDIDMCVEGQIDDAPYNTWEDSSGTPSFKLSGVVRFSKQKFLHVLADRLEERKVAANLERIMHARIPVFNYVDKMTGLHCDVIVGGPESRIKPTVLGLLEKIDWRFQCLVRMVKIWAKNFNLIDASCGFLNSYSLTLLVLFHLQTRPVQVLPSISSLVKNAKRPLSGDSTKAENCVHFCESLLEGIRRYITNKKRPGNKETLCELFLSFVSFLHGVLEAPKEIAAELGVSSSDVMQYLRIDTWNGRFKYTREAPRNGHTYHLWVEDPLDSSSDNASRSLSLSGAEDLLLAAKRAHSDFLEKVCKAGKPSILSMLEYFDSMFGPDASKSARHEYHLLEARNGEFRIDDMLNSCEDLLLRNTQNNSKTLTLISQPVSVSFGAERQIPDAIHIETRYTRTLYHLEEIVDGLREQREDAVDIFQKFCRELTNASHLDGMNPYYSDSESYSDLDIGHGMYRSESGMDDPFENEYFDYSSDDYIT